MGLLEAGRLAGEGVVSAVSSSAEKLALFNSLFAMRSDVYAKSYFNKKTSRVGYAPACANEWVRGVCGKPRVKCAECAHRDFKPLDDVVLKRHFVGSDQEGVGIVAALFEPYADQWRFLSSVKSMVPEVLAKLLRHFG